MLCNNIQLIMQDLETAALYLTVKLWNPTLLIQTFGWNHHVMGLRSNNKDKREKQQLPSWTDRFCRRSTVLRIAWWFLKMTLAQFVKLTYINEYNHLVLLLSWVTLLSWRDYKWPAAALGHGRHKKFLKILLDSGKMHSFLVKKWVLLFVSLQCSS